MLEITIARQEFFNEQTEKFFTIEGVILSLEHSLVSISKWESIFCKSFLNTTDKTNEEVLEYIKCMTVNGKHVDPLIYSVLSQEHISKIVSYIDRPMTATTFSVKKQKPSREIITSEIIYFWMISFQIPFECQKWHLNRLLTLINVLNLKNQPTKKKSSAETIAENRALNAERLKQTKSKG